MSEIQVLTNYKSVDLSGKKGIKICFGEDSKFYEKVYNYNNDINDEFIDQVDNLFIESSHERSYWIANLLSKDSLDERIVLHPFVERMGYPNKYFYYDVILRWIEKNQSKYDNIIVFSRNPYLLLSLRRFITNGIGRIWLYSSVAKYILNSISSFSLSIAFMIKLYTAKIILFPFYKSKFKNKHARKKIAIIHTQPFTDNSTGKRCIGSKFGNLDIYLEDKGYTVLYDLDLSFVRITSDRNWIKNTDKYIYIPFYLNLGDYLGAFAFLLNQLFFFLHLKQFRENLVFPFWPFHAIIKNYLKSKLIEVLSKDIDLQLVYIPWENRGYQKILSDKRRWSAKDIHLINYSAGMITKVDPELNTTPYEVSHYPEINILAMSEFVGHALYNAGYKNIYLAPPIRSMYLFTTNPTPINIRENKRILFIMPLESTSAKQFIALAKQVAVQVPEYDIVLKPHPYSGILNSETFQTNVKIAKGNLQNILTNTTIVVFSGVTTAAAEALVYGKIVIRYKSKNDFSVDCLANMDIPTVRQAEEIIEIIENLGKFHFEKDIDYYREYFFSSRVLKDECVYDSFVPPLKEMD